ncbi:MAG: RecQ family ATP-dependent DNA helicase, partial [Luteolibacter sp.]
MSLQSLSSCLKQTFGYDEFRPLQREIMETSLAGRDALAILPTGAGKSLCYQLPALVREGLTIVVSPLIALMKDQVDQLEASGVSATFLNSTLEPEEARRRLDGLDQGNYRMLYVAPERLMLSDFLPLLKGWKVSALAVDEAHCISEWGHDFRPEYRRLKEVRQWTGSIPILALTATATERVREDIVKQLELENPARFLASFNRPNLKYQVIPKAGAAAQICNFVNARPEDSGIVYCQSRKNTEALAITLRSHGFSAVAYHAGLDAAERAKNQDAFLRDEAKIVCATVAFGMGINKPNVR